MDKLQAHPISKRQLVHFWIYFVGLCLFVTSLPISPFMLTISQIIIGVNWIIEGNYSIKFNKFLNNKPAIAFTLIYILFVVGLIWTEDIRNAFRNDILHKLPTLTLTFFIVTSYNIDIKKIRFLLLLFIFSILVVSFIGFYKFLFVDLINYRDILPFGSHLYYNLMLIMAVFMLPWVISKITENKYILMLSFVLSIWMLFFLFLIRSLSGVASLAGVLLFLLIWAIYRIESLFIKVCVICVFIITIAFSGYIINNIYNHATNIVYYDFDNLEQYTTEGNKYNHDTINTMRENGYLVYLYISDQELQEEWNDVSSFDYNGLTINNQSLKHTLYRYMTSKGYRKDREHLGLLDKSDIEAIEKGTYNYLYFNKPGIYERIHQTIAGTFIYQETHNPKWSTFAQRMDLWQASITAFKKYPILGWGTGDIFKAVQYGLEKNESYFFLGIDVKPHNQFLLILNSIGIIGLLLFFTFYIYTVYKTKGYRRLHFNIFMVAYGVNMLGNNPIDAQLGQSLFVFFTVLFCFMIPNAEESQKQLNI
jgi:hypothetical protein